MIVPTNFGELWTCFGSSIDKISQEHGLEKLCSARAGFSLLPVEPTLAFLSAGSTGEWFCHLLGFLGFFCGCTSVSVFVSIGSTGVTCEHAVLIV